MFIRYCLYITVIVYLRSNLLSRTRGGGVAMMSGEREGSRGRSSWVEGLTELLTVVSDVVPGLRYRGDEAAGGRIWWAGDGREE